MRAPRVEPGISVLIPERDQVEELAVCLDSVARAAGLSPEPVETIILVNGAAPFKYGCLRRQFNQCRWLFVRQPLGFNEAVRRALRAARSEWVYLLNSDAAIDAEALARLLPHRAPDVFSIGSQILLKDPTRYREETNWTAFLIEDGLATVHDRIPPRGGTSECFYTGGGASLFQRRVLAALVADSAAYSPFYWEDVEWGWRARKLGYKVLFCADSIALHTQRATIRANYTADEVEQILERNRLLFQLRNLTAAGSLDRVFEEIARLPPSAAACFERLSMRWAIARLRLWNHLAHQ
jgi:GT2 family glycosyltransferase